MMIKKFSIGFALLIVLTVAGLVHTNAVHAEAPTIERLQSALAEDPDNYALHYYLGVMYNREGNTRRAFEQWSEYVIKAPFNRRTVTVREQLTVLRQRLATERAREVATGAVTLETPDNSIAILEFQNPDRPELRPLAKGLNAMIITDISKVEGLTVVERTQAQALMREMQLAQSGIADSETSGRVGRLLAAQAIDWGRIDIEGDQIVINNIVSDTASNNTIDDFSAGASQSDFFSLQKQIVFQILQAMGISEDDLDDDTLAELQEIDTRNFAAFQAFGEGLVFLDEGNFSEARASFEQAATLDPEFDLAQDAVVETPSDDTAIVDNALGFDWDEETEEEATDESEEEAEAVAAVDDAVTGTDQDSENEVTSDLAQQETLVETENADTAGPRFDGNDGFATGLLANTEGEFHGVFGNENLGSALNLTIEGSAFPPSNATIVAVDVDGDGLISVAGDVATLDSLQVSDSFPDSPIVSGLPQNLELTQLGESEFLTWGTWTTPNPVFRDPADGVPPEALGYQFEPLNYFIAGDATTPDQIASLSSLGGTAIYSGTALGTAFGGQGLVMGGAFRAVVDITQLSVTDFDLNVTSGVNSLSIANATGLFDTATSTVNMTNGTWVVNGTQIDNASVQYVNLSAFGPEADEAAGNFGIDPDGTGANAVGGIFYGDTETTLASGIFLAAPLRDENGNLLGGLVASTAVEDPNIWGGGATLKTNTINSDIVRRVRFAGTQNSIFQLEEAEFNADGDISSVYNANVFDLTLDQVTLNTFTHFSINAWEAGPIARGQSDVALDNVSYQISDAFVLLGDYTQNVSSLGLTNTQAGYTGPAYASVSTAPGTQLTGDFTAFIDFAALAVTDFDISVSSGDISFSLENGSGNFNDEFGIAFALSITGELGGTFHDEQSALALARSENFRLQLFGPDASEAGGTFQTVYFDDLGDPLSLISGVYGGQLDPDLVPEVAPQLQLMAPLYTAGGVYYSNLGGSTTDADPDRWSGSALGILQGRRVNFEGDFESILPVSEEDPTTTPELFEYTGAAFDVDWTTNVLATAGAVTIASWTDPLAGTRGSPSLFDLGQGYAFNETGFAVYGAPSTVADLATLGADAFFSGPAFGYSTSAPDDLMTGTFTALVDFVALSILDFDLAIASATRRFAIEDASGNPGALNIFDGSSSTRYSNFANEFAAVFSDIFIGIEVLDDGSSISGTFDELYFEETVDGEIFPIGSVFGAFGGTRNETLVTRELLLQIPVFSETTGGFQDMLSGGRLDSQSPFRWFGTTNQLTPGKELVVEGNFGEITTASERNDDVTPEERVYYTGAAIPWLVDVVADFGSATVANLGLPASLSNLGDGYTFGSGFVVFGDPSTVADLASLGTNAVYTGQAYGYSTGAPDDLLTGQVIAQIDFVAGSILQFDIALSSDTRNYGVLIIPAGSGDTFQPSFGRLSLSDPDTNFRGIDFTSDFGIDVVSTGFEMELEVFGDGSTIAGTFAESYVDAATQIAAGSFFGAFGATLQASSTNVGGTVAFPVFDASGSYFEFASGRLGNGSSTASAFLVVNDAFDSRRLRFIGDETAFINVRAEDVPTGTPTAERIRKFYTGPEISFRENETVLYQQGDVLVTSWAAPNGATALLDIDDIGYDLSRPGFATYSETVIDAGSLVGVIGFSGDAFAYSTSAPDDLMSGTFSATIDYTADRVLDLDVSVSSATRSYSFVDAVSQDFGIPGIPPDDATAASSSNVSVSFLSDFEQGGQPASVTGAGVSLTRPTTNQFITGTFSSGVNGPTDPATGSSESIGMIYGAFGGEAISGPQQEQGYWANAAVADNGAYHGVFLTDGVQDLNSWSATGSAFSPSSATGTLDEITTLQISDGFPSNPLTGGLPNAVSFSETVGVSEFMEWGGWSDTDPMSREPQTGLAPGQISYTFSPIGYYVYGDTTTQTDIASLGGVATYSGDAFGTHYASPDEVMTGSFSGEVDFVSTELLTFALSISSPSHSLSFDNGGVAAQYQFPGTNGGQAAFAPQNVVVDGVSVGTPTEGNTYFTLYGPGAEEAGGVFFVDPDGLGTEAIHGMFQGVRQ